MTCFRARQVSQEALEDLVEWDHLELEVLQAAQYT